MRTIHIAMLLTVGVAALTGCQQQDQLRADAERWVGSDRTALEDKRGPADEVVETDDGEMLIYRSFWSVRTQQGPHVYTTREGQTAMDSPEIKDRTVVEEQRFVVDKTGRIISADVERYSPTR